MQVFKRQSLPNFFSHVSFQLFSKITRVGISAKVYLSFNNQQPKSFQLTHHFSSVSANKPLVTYYKSKIKKNFEKLISMKKSKGKLQRYYY